MPLTLPNLDDRDFEGLVAAGKRLIPSLAPSWTDHNPSDPGITLVELFASIAELLIYRADRVSDANRQAFIRLLWGGDPDRPLSGFRSIEDEIRAAVIHLRSEERAVTADDFCDRATEDVRVVRAHCLPNCNADAETRRFDAPAHVSVLVVPQRTPGPDQDLIGALKAVLEPICMLTTRLHVAGPSYLKVRVCIKATVFADQNEDVVHERIKQRLSDFFDPRRGGDDGKGWPFGGAIYRSALFAQLDGIDGVDFIEPVAGQDVLRELTPRLTNRSIDDGAGLRLEPDELVELAPIAPFGTALATLAGEQSWIGIERLVDILPEE